MGATRSASALGHVKATLKSQVNHKLDIARWNITFTLWGKNMNWLKKPNKIAWPELVSVLLSDVVLTLQCWTMDENSSAVFIQAVALLQF